MKSLKQMLLASLLVVLHLTTHAQSSTNTKASNKKVKTMKVLFVLTSHDKLGNTGEKTGFWIEEFATPYYTLIDQGFEITIASPKGGQPPIDPKSNQAEFSTPSTKRFYSDAATQKKLSQSLKLKDVKENDFDAVFYPGGHGPLWDLTDDAMSTSLIESFYQHNKPVALVCHAPAVLKNVKDKNGEPLVKGKKITGFTNSEEAAVKLTDVVPFLLENMLKEKGATFVRGNDWGAFAIEDGLLITGQNPASSELVAQKLIQSLSNRNN